MIRPRATILDRPRLKITTDYRAGAGALGRFGGGWHWKLGVQASRNFRTVIVSLLVASVRFEIGRRS